MQTNTIKLLGTVGAICLISAVMIPRADPQTVSAPSPGGTSAAVTSDEPQGWHESSALVLTRDGTGQFHIDARVNGETINFLVDTGADMVALTVEDAENLGLSYGEMEPIMQTAGGVGYGAPVMIDEIEVGGMTMRNVPAIVAQDLPVNLLGQSVLGQLGSVQLSGDRMTIRAR